MADAEGEPGLERLCALARAGAEAPVDRETHGTGRVRLLDTAAHVAVVARARRVAPRESTFRPVAALAALLGAVALVVLHYWEAPLSYDVRGNANSLPSYVSAPRDAPADVRFSDGSDVVARPGTRLRIEETKSRGARVLVERGEAAISVRHRSRTDWAFVAGPFEVRVTGTKLTIHWDPDSERIDVTLHEGSVEIETPIGPSHYAVTAGHTFHASARDGTVKLEDEQAPVAKNDAPRDPVTTTARAAAAATPLARDAVTPETTPRARDTVAMEATLRGRDTAEAAEKEAEAQPEPWPKRVRRGEFAEVVAAAQARGVSDCVAKCSSSDLRALADAARYTGASDLAIEALRALRSRFKGSRDGAAAAFLLGRTAESTGDLTGADRWYETYLSESPSGALAADALAGRMLAAERLGAPSRARELARVYVERYPDGAAIRTARKLAGPD